MSLAIDTIDQMIKDYIEETDAIPHHIPEIDHAIGHKIQVMKEVRQVVMTAELKVIEQERAPAPKGCAYHTFREVCANCGHPEYCPKYGSRSR